MRQGLKTLVRTLLGCTVKPILQGWYLRADRRVRVLGLDLQVSRDVFHPGLFFSSRFLASYLQGLDLRGKKLLDLGCGSGVLSLIAAKKGAQVHAVDINAKAVTNTKLNAERNGVQLQAYESDLMAAVTGEFDVVVINPPYFPGNPETIDKHAWYCGAGFEYFDRLYSQLKIHVPDTVLVLMILSDLCDLNKISELARKNQYEMKQLKKKNFFIETNFIFQVTRCELQEQAIKR